MLERGRFLAYSTIIVVLALLVREYYVLVSQVVNPYGGDPREYITYAQNLMHGVFSKSASSPTPDAYRTPGYPAFLMLSMLWEGDWYPRLLQMQVVLGTLTVVGVIGLARQWLAPGWALLAGVLMALWPHHIAATSEVLSEVLFGFVLVAALWLTALALDRRSMALSVGAGAAYGVAYLVNPIIALFPLVVVAVFWRERLVKHGVALALVAMLGVIGWSARSAHIGANGSERAYINLVQGSWPLYQLAYVSRNADPEPARIIQAIGEESTLLVADHAAGFRAMRERIAREPITYARWYLGKPFLLWDWDIRIGEGDVYVHPVHKSPLQTHPMLRAVTSVLKAANPWIFAVSLTFALYAAWRAPPTVRLVALAFLYVTAIHTLLQAEPRYAVAYRPLQMLLIAAALSWSWERYRLRFPRRP